MAIPIRLVNITTATASGNNITTITPGAWASSPVAGNLLLGIGFRGGAGTATAPTWTTPSGWTNPISNIGAHVSDQGANVATAALMAGYACSKIAAGGDTIPTFTITGAGGGAGTTEIMTAVIFELFGGRADSGEGNSHTTDSAGTPQSFSSQACSSMAAPTLATGDFGVSCLAWSQAAAMTTTVSNSAGWVTAYSDGGTSQNVHVAVAYFLNIPGGVATAGNTFTLGTSTTTASWFAYDFEMPANRFAPLVSPSGSPIRDSGANVSQAILTPSVW